MSRTHGEFSGSKGLIQPEQAGHETEEQQLWEIYATNPASTAADGQPIAANVNRGARPDLDPVVDANSRPQTVGQGGSLKDAR